MGYLHISAVNYPISIKFGIQIQIFIPSMQIWQKNRNFANSRWRTDAILKIVFWRYLGSISADQRQIWNRDEGSHADIGHVTKSAILRKFKMADRRHFENSIISISQPRIIRFRSNLVGRCRLQFPWWSFNKEIEILHIQDGERTPYWKSFFGYISAPYWPINAKFGTEMKDHMPMQVTWPNLQFSQIQDGGPPPFWK